DDPFARRLNVVAQAPKPLLVPPLSRIRLVQLPEQPRLIIGLPIDSALQMPELAAELELGHHLPAERPEPVALLPGKLSRNPVNHAKSAEGVMIPADERGSRVKPNSRMRANQRIRGEPFVRRRIWHDQK